MIKQVVVAMLLMTGTAAATCGPRLELDASVNQTENDNEAIGGYYDNTLDERRDTDYAKVGVKLVFQLGEDYCTEQESAKLRRDEGYADRAELDNVEKVLRLCKQYGDNHPLLEGKCN